MADGGWPGGLANHKFRLNGDFGDVFASSFDQIDDGLCRDLPHLYEWLPDGGEAGVGVRGARDVVEADNRNVFRNTEAGFADRPDRADGRNVVVSKKCSERLFPGQELLGEGISNPRRRIEALQLNGQFGTNANAELLRHLTDRVPTHRGIRTHGLPSNEGDFFMPEIAKMFERQPRGTCVVQYDVGQAFDALMPCHRNGGQSKLLRERRIRGDESFDAARQ